MPKKKSEESRVLIKPPNIAFAVFKAIGESPYVQLKFSEKASNAMKEKHKAGNQSSKGKKREPRDFDQDYINAFHISQEGWYGIPAAAFRSAMVRASKLAGFNMKDAKVTLFVMADGCDATSGDMLVRIYGEPEPYEATVRNATGVADIRVRAMWREWKANITIKYNADVFSLSDVANVLLRAGQFVGIGEGRPDSKNSAGLGFGLFRIGDEND